MRPQPSLSYYPLREQLRTLQSNVTLSSLHQARSNKSRKLTSGTFSRFDGPKAIIVYLTLTPSGYLNALVIESAFEDTSGDLHFPSDIVEEINFEHILQHAKMVVGFMHEMGFAADL